MNYQALGEFTAFSEQAKDAADRRFALLHNLSAALSGLSKNPGLAVDGEALAAQLREAGVADREMRAAIERANAAAPLCGREPGLSPSRFARG